MSLYAHAVEVGAVAEVFDPDGGLVDVCFCWEAAQNYVLHEGLVAVAIADDGHMTIAAAQQLYDSDRAAYLDCWA
jgi:hypothetical protein